jgi:hypothetical protein
MSEYNRLSDEEKEAYVLRVKNARIEKDLEQDKTLRRLSHKATADVRAVVSTLIAATKHLPERSGYAILSLGARTDYGQTAEPVDLVPEVLAGFCETVLHRTPLRLAQEMETFLLKGGAGDCATKEARSKDIRSDVSERLRLSFGAFFYLISTRLDI